MARLPDDEDLRYRREAMPSNLSLAGRNSYRVGSLTFISIPPRHLHKRMAMRAGWTSIAWLVAPPWLQAYAASFLSAVLARNAWNIWSWWSEPRTEKARLPLHTAIDFLPPDLLLSHLCHWHSNGAKATRNISSFILQFAVGPDYFFHERFLMFFDTLMTPLFYQHVAHASDGAELGVTGRKYLMDMALHLLLAAAAWWLEQRMLALTVHRFSSISATFLLSSPEC